MAPAPSVPSQVLIWDLPIRLFHWLLAGGFIAAALIALTGDEHGTLFPYHAIIGLVLALMLALRLIWGLIGSRHARFRAFLFGPVETLRYFAAAPLGRAKTYAGHNPGAALVYFAMFALLITLAVTGVMLGRGNENVKDLHEICAYAMLAAVGAHLAGLALHTIQHRHIIAAAMVHGRKPAPAHDAIPSARPIIMLVFLAITAAWTIALLRNYSSATRSLTLPVIGAPLQVGEAENQRPERSRLRGESRDD